MAEPRNDGPPDSKGESKGDGKGERARADKSSPDKSGDKSGGREVRQALEIVEPIGKRVLIRKDEDKKITKGGVHLPDKIEIPTLTGRVVAVSAEIARNADYPIQQYDRILFNPKHAIPVDFEGDNRLFVVPIEDIVAVFRKS